MYARKNEGRRAFVGSAELKNYDIMIFVNTLVVKNLTAAYKDKLILNNISLNASSGEFICLCGPNGSGKSTLLSLLAGLPYDGLKITKADSLPQVNGQTITSLKRKECAKILAYLQQSEFSQWNFTVRDFVLQGRFAFSKNGIWSKEDYKITDEVLSELGLTDFAERKIHNLSGGEFQKVRIARCLAQKPLFMLLDEPSSSLDYVYEPHLLEFLKETAHKNDIGIITTIHNINLANRYADRIMLLPPGKNIITGEKEKVMSLENLKTTFGVDFKCENTKSFHAS